MLDLIGDQPKHGFALCSEADLGTTEKRGSPRLPWAAELEVTLLPTLGEGAQTGRVLKAEANNAAKGGIGMTCDQPIAPGTVVRCDIALSAPGIHIPTILKVRWIEPPEGKNRYRLGLEFLV